MTPEADQGDSKPPPHGHSGEGTASILPHLSSPHPSSPDQQQPKPQVSQLDAPAADDNHAGPA